MTEANSAAPSRAAPLSLSPNAAGRLHHLALGARDVERLASFYEELFALAQLAVHHRDDGQVRSIWLDLNPGILMIEHTVEPARLVNGVGSGPFLLAFWVDDLERFGLRLQTYGISCEARTLWSSYFRDPEGNRLAVSRYEVDPP